MAAEKDYYLPSEIAELMTQAGKSKSTFYRLVNDQKIGKRLVSNQEVYDGPSVNAFLNGQFGAARKKQTIVRSPKKRETVETDWIKPEDLIPLYVFDVEAHGMDRAIEASTMRTWHEQNPFLTRILYKPSNRSQILGAITILPLPEESILRIMKGETTEKDINTADILYYQSGKAFVCDIAFAAVNSHYKKYLLELFHSFFDFWSQIPNLSICKLYTLANSPEWDEVIAQHYFAPRYDIKSQTNVNQPDSTDVYELDLRRPNFSPKVKELKKTMNLLTVASRESSLIASIQDFITSDTDTITFEKANRRDLQACYDIDMGLYGPGESNPVSVREDRYDKVPDGFYVLKDRGEVVAHTSFLPVDPSELKRIKAGIPGRIPMEKISPFVIGRPLDIYFIILSVKKDSDPTRRYALRTLAGLTHVFRQLGAQGVNIQHIFAFSRTPDGIRICENVGMNKEPFANDPERFMFEMNLQTGAPKIAREYQAGLAEYRTKLKQQEFSSNDL